MQCVYAAALSDLREGVWSLGTVPDGCELADVRPGNLL